MHKIKYILVVAHCFKLNVEHPQNNQNDVETNFIPCYAQEGFLVIFVCKVFQKGLLFFFVQRFSSSLEDRIEGAYGTRRQFGQALWKILSFHTLIVFAQER